MWLIKYISFVATTIFVIFLLDNFSLPHILLPLGIGAFLVFLVFMEFWKNETEDMLLVSGFLLLTTIVLIGIYAAICIANELPIIDSFLDGSHNNFTRIDFVIWGCFSAAMVSLSIYLLSKIHEKPT